MLGKEPQRTLLSADDLAEDLQRFLNGEAISISRPRLFDRLQRALGRDHQDVQFRAWSTMLYHFAWIVFAGNFAVFLIGEAPVSKLLVWAGAFRIAEFLGMVSVLWFRRADWYPPRGKPARQHSAFWLAYFASTGTLTLIELEQAVTIPGREFGYLELYPRLAVVSSLGLIMLGSTYWGFCYAIGGIFLLLSLILPFCPISPFVVWTHVGVRAGRFGPPLWQIGGRRLTRRLPLYSPGSSAKRCGPAENSEFRDICAAGALSS